MGLNQTSGGNNIVRRKQRGSSMTTTVTAVTMIGISYQEESQRQNVRQHGQRKDLYQIYEMG